MDGHEQHGNLPLNMELANRLVNRPRFPSYFDAFPLESNHPNSTIWTSALADCQIFKF